MQRRILIGKTFLVKNMLTKAPFKTSSRNGLKDFGPCFAAQRCGDVIVARRAAAMTRDPACAIQMAHQCRVIAKVIPVSHKKKIVMEGAQSMLTVMALTAEKVVMVGAEIMPTVMALNAEVRRAAHPQVTAPQLV